MSTYLFTWNRARWPWTHLQDSVADVKNNGFCSESWSCGVTKKIRIGDRAFLIKLGGEPRGIVASGWVTRGVYRDRHWDKMKYAKGQAAQYVDLHWDTLLDPDVNIFPRARLGDKIYSDMCWEPRASGVRIPDEVAVQLEMDWALFLNRPFVVNDFSYADEIDVTKNYVEGAARQITVNVHERSAEARTVCINHFGLNCCACGFNFEKTYGKIGSGFIHVHHLKSLSEIGKNYRLNPIDDLRPVCPNCHAMLHRRKPAYSIDELKQAMKRKK